MKKLYILLVLAFLGFPIFGQQLTQTVRGKVVDVDSEWPLIGAEIIVVGSAPLLGTTTDASGNFRLNQVPVGRITLQISYLGYQQKLRSNIVVNSGKEVVLDIGMEESAVTMEEVVVMANPDKGTALNEMALISARSISPEQTNRYAGGFNDPARILSNFAGITSTQDGSSDIIVRGNAPKYVQWRLEGIQITNPNHFADQSAVSGSVSTLNNNLLATSDFYTGAFAPEFGDALSGVYDVRLRSGNNEKLEAVFGFGLLGTDLTLEGPINKKTGGSFIVNYRYSTASIIGELGLIDEEVNGIPKFQDAAFKLVLPTEKLGTFSLFGLGGFSEFLLEDISPAIWQTPGNRGRRADIMEDFDKSSYLINLGLNHTLPVNKKSYIKTTLAYSQERIEDEVFESHFMKIFDDRNEFVRDSILNRLSNYQGLLSKSIYRGAITYNYKINARNKLQVGSKYAHFNYDSKQSQFLESPADRMTLTNFKEHIGTLRNFVSWKHRFNDEVSLVGGLHNMNVLFNNKSTIEPRLALNWKLGTQSTLHFGYGLHSNMESIHNYFAQVEFEDGSIVEPNRNLDLLKAHHYVMGYERRFGPHLRAKVEVYYQDLFDLPVENDVNSFYATVNEGLEFRFVDLVNRGTGKNYGVELTLERFFHNNYYYLINASLYESKYTPLDGIERNTRYNGQYLFNILFGKEYTGLGKKKNRSLGLNAKAFFGGGQKTIPLLRDETGQLAVDPLNNRYYDFSKAYEDHIENIYQIILSVSYKWNRPKATHEIFMNLDNITNNKGRIAEFYDPEEPNSIGYQAQFGFFPNLMYRVYF